MVRGGFSALNGFWKRASAQEVLKFGFYLAVPVCSSVFYADPDFMHSLIRKLKFVEYPKVQYSEPTMEERENIRKAMKRLEEKKWNSIQNFARDWNKFFVVAQTPSMQELNEFVCVTQALYELLARLWCIVIMAVDVRMCSFNGIIYVHQIDLESRCGCELSESLLLRLIKSLHEHAVKYTGHSQEFAADILIQMLSLFRLLPYLHRHMPSWR